MVPGLFYFLSFYREIQRNFLSNFVSSSIWYGNFELEPSWYPTRRGCIEEDNRCTEHLPEQLIVQVPGGLQADAVVHHDRAEVDYDTVAEGASKIDRQSIPTFFII